MAHPLPTSNRKWLREIERAYSKAEERIEKGAIRFEDVYKLAAELAARRRGASDDLLKQASTMITKEIAENRAREDTGEYVFEFFASYIDAHVHFGYLDEDEAERVLDYVSITGDLFLYDDDDA